MEETSPAPVAPAVPSRKLPVYLLLPLVLTIGFFFGTLVGKTDTRDEPEWQIVPTGTPLPTSTPRPAPTETPIGTPDEIGRRRMEEFSYAVDNSGWLTLRSNLLKVSFVYPVKSGTVSFLYSAISDDRKTDPSGRVFQWTNNSRVIAGGISDNFTAGREGSYYDFYNIATSASDTVVQTFQTKYGTTARLVRAPWLGYGADDRERNHKEKLLQIDIPFPKDTRFGGLVMFFDDISLSDAERIVNSVTLDR